MLERLEQVLRRAIADERAGDDPALARMTRSLAEHAIFEHKSGNREPGRRLLVSMGLMRSRRKPQPTFWRAKYRYAKSAGDSVDVLEIRSDVNSREQ
jgi:hypothetical protein